MYIKELTNEEFISFTNTFPYKSFYQTPEYAFVMNHEKNEAFFIGLVDDNYILAATLVIVEKRSGFKYAYTPRGFILNATISFFPRNSFSSFVNSSTSV